MTKVMIEAKIWTKDAVLDGTLSDISRRVEALTALYGEQARIILDSGYDSLSGEIVYMRLETDAEHAQRLTQEQQKADREEKARKKEFQNLTELADKHGYTLNPKLIK